MHTTYKITNTKYHTVGTFLISNHKIVETETKSIPIKPMYMTDHFSDLEQAFQQEMAGLKEFYGPKNGTIRIIGFSCTCTV